MRAALLEAANEPFVIDDTRQDRRPWPRLRAGQGVELRHLPLRPHRRARRTATPIVLGHEAAGVVDAVGEGVTILAPGDSVVLTPIAPCGRCYFCRAR